MILPHEFIFVCIGISLGRYCHQSLAKSRGFEKNITRGGGHIREVFCRGERVPSPRYDLSEKDELVFGAPVLEYNTESVNGKG